jgi:hypothetical protein
MTQMPIATSSKPSNSSQELLAKTEKIRAIPTMKTKTPAARPKPNRAPCEIRVPVLRSWSEDDEEAMS